MQTQNQSKRNIPTFRLFLILFPKWFRAKPLLKITLIIISIAESLLFAVETVVLQNLYENIIEFATENLRLVFVLLAVLLWFAVKFSGRALSWLEQVLSHKNDTNDTIRLQTSLFEKIGHKEPIDFSDTDKLEDMELAKQGCDSVTYFVSLAISLVTDNVPYIIFMSVYLWLIYPPLVFCILFVFIPTILGSFLKKKIKTDYDDEVTPIVRKHEYFTEVLTSRDAYKEIRTTGCFSFLADKWSIALRKKQKIDKKMDSKSRLLNSAIAILNSLGYAAILFVLYLALLKGKIGIAIFAAVFQSVDELFRQMDNLVDDRFSSLLSMNSEISKYVQLYREMPRRESGNSLKIPCDITMDRVSFTYPNATVKALDGVSLTIKSGECIAIVGENGAGKSTLLRILTGLYLPTEGVVRYGDTATDKVSLKKLNAQSSAVFQKFQKYKMTLGENVSVSDTEKEADNERISECLHQVGIDENSGDFPNGFDTMLSPEFGGVDLSGGQWQRIAIARGNYRQSRLIFLDEPTSAIDPNEENRIHTQFRAMSAGKTSIIVTHRLGAARIADRILVMKQGKLVEAGTHENLIAQNGEYTRLWQLQSEWYR